MKLNGAQIVIETLIEQGTTTVFGYPGGQVINIYDALYLASDRIHHIITAHEQGASHAADGYARATGKVGVVINGLSGLRSAGCHHRQCSELSDWTG